MADERPPGQRPDEPDEVLYPAPADIEHPRARAAPTQNGTVDELIELTGRVVAPFVRLGWRGARGVSRRIGLDDAVSRSFDRALESDTAERAAERVLGSDSAIRVWDKVLESEEAQKLVERVAEAPEVRSAITMQGVGLLEDVRRTARKAARRLDDFIDRAGRSLLRRPQRSERPIYAGGATRLLAIGVDALLLSAILIGISTVVALLLNALFSIEGDATGATIAFGAAAWWAASVLYLGGFWILAERTPGMTFFGLRISTEGGGRVGPRQDVRRLIGFGLALIPFGLGFVGVVTNDRRRGWQDRFADTVVLYADPELDDDLTGWRPPPATQRR